MLTNTSILNPPICSKFEKCQIRTFSHIKKKCHYLCTAVYKYVFAFSAIFFNIKKVQELLPWGRLCPLILHDMVAPDRNPRINSHYIDLVLLEYSRFSTKTPSQYKGDLSMYGIPMLKIRRSRPSYL